MSGPITVCGSLLCWVSVLFLVIAIAYQYMMTLDYPAVLPSGSAQVIIGTFQFTVFATPSSGPSTTSSSIIDDTCYVNLAGTSQLAFRSCSVFNAFRGLLVLAGLLSMFTAPVSSICACFNVLKIKSWRVVVLGSSILTSILTVSSIICLVTVRNDEINAQQDRGANSLNWSWSFGCAIVGACCSLLAGLVFFYGTKKEFDTQQQQETDPMMLMANRGNPYIQFNNNNREGEGER